LGYSSALDGSVGQDRKAKPPHTSPPVGLAVLTSNVDSPSHRPFVDSSRLKTKTSTSKITSQDSPIAPADKRNSTSSVESSFLQSQYEGLPSELLQGMSALSGSMFSGSESEGETILSAMASALRLCKERAPASNPTSPGSSMDGAVSVTKSVSPNLTSSGRNSQGKSSASYFICLFS